jgi:hypothetical protein
VKKTLFVLALVALASVTLFAQNSQTYGTPARVESNIAKGGPVIQSHEPAGLKKIYSNFGASTSAFDYTNGWLIDGSTSPLGHEQWVGYAFTPTKAHIATQLRASAFYYAGFGSGGNDVNIGIWKDASGVPGTEIRGRDKSNLPTWTGTSTDCCKTQNVKIKATKLKKGTQYWVVLTNGSKDTTASGVWDFTFGDPTGTQAYNLGTGWLTETVQISGFAVYGTK